MSTDRNAVTRLINAAEAADLRVDDRYRVVLLRLDELAAEKVGEEHLHGHRQRVAEAVVQRVLSGQPADFVAEWEAGNQSALSLPAWQSHRAALDRASGILWAELAGEVSAALRAEFPRACSAVLSAFQGLGGDVSVTSALKAPKVAQQGVAAIEHLRALVNLTDVLLRDGGKGKSGLSADYFAGDLDRPVDWAGEPLVLLGELGMVLTETGPISDPLAARMPVAQMAETA